jgi:hypothetical protein
MTATKEDMSLNRVLAILSILAIVIGGASWVFTTQAIAQRADTNAKSALEKLDKKADKDQVDGQLKRIFDKLDSMDNYLRDRR